MFEQINDDRNVNKTDLMIVFYNRYLDGQI